MVDFTDYLNKKEDEISFDLEAFYAGLDAKGTHTEPRPAQREALRDLTIRHAERDIVLKISTGAGKTTVGLLFLYGHMKISKLPSVYLCPTTQLLSQVLAEAQRLGIEARHYAFAADEARLALALAERDAYVLAATNRAMDGKTRLHRAINDVALQEEELGIYLQRLARITYQIDPGESMKLQQSARLKNYATSMPPELPRQVLSAGSKTTAQKVALWVSQFNPLTAAVVEAQRIVAKLDLGGNFRTVEAGFLELGRLIGADASAPDSEYSEGPDCLWLLNGAAYVIEAKNENEKSLHKKDAGQMLVSVEWVKRHYPQYADKIQPVVIAKVTELDHDALYPEGTWIVTGEDCQKIGTALVQFLNKVAQEGPLFATPDNIHAQLQAFGLLNEQFFAKFGRKLR